MSRLRNLSDSELELIVTKSARALREAQEELQRREDLDHAELPAYQEFVDTLTKIQCEELLAKVGIQTYDHESLEILREAVRVNLCDGTLNRHDYEG